MNYREETDITAKYKKAYVDGICHVLKKRQKEAGYIEASSHRVFRYLFLCHCG